MSRFTWVIVGLAIGAIVVIPGYFIVNIYIADFGNDSAEEVAPAQVGNFPSPNQPVDANDPTTWQPEVVTAEDAGTTITLAVGQFLTLPEVANGQHLFTDSPSILAVAQPNEPGIWDNGAAAQAVAEGTTKFGVLDDEKNRLYTVTANVVPVTSGETVAPPTWQPVVLTAETRSIKLVPEQIAIFPDAIDGSTAYEFAISDKSVASVASPNTDGSGIGVKAKGAGVAEVTAIGGSLNEPLVFKVEVTS